MPYYDSDDHFDSDVSDEDDTWRREEDKWTRSRKERERAVMVAYFSSVQNVAREWDDVLLHFVKNGFRLGERGRDAILRTHEMRAKAFYKLPVPNFDTRIRSCFLPPDVRHWLDERRHVKRWKLARQIFWMEREMWECALRRTREGEKWWASYNTEMIRKHHTLYWFYEAYIKACSTYMGLSTETIVALYEGRQAAAEYRFRTRMELYTPTTLLLKA